MHSVSARCTLLQVASAFALILAFPAAAQVIGDYGDAPDGGPTGYPVGFAQIGAFPTSLASDGARALASTGAHLGVGESLEDGASDPADPDGVPNLTGTDADDGVTGLVIQLVSIPPPAFLDINISVPAGGTGGTYFVNVLIDLNMDGAWGGVIQPGVTEWPIQNLPVTVAAGGNVPLRTPFFLFGAGNRLPDPAWMRLAVTPTPVAANWAGTGSFASGEIEDHLVTLPQLGGKALATPNIACPPGLFIFPDGVAQIAFQCFLNNPGPPGNVLYRLTRETGGVTVGQVLPPPPIAAAPQIANTIPMATDGPPTVLNLIANRGALPSDWTARAKGVDPPSTVNAKGVVAGFGDSLASVTFSAPTEPPIDQRPLPPQQKPQEQKDKSKN